jgi:putative IMPACT (imprinted ancient) family translation regulator
VVRYFGGILLGTSGLIKAYKKAAEDALNHAEITQKIICEKMQLQFHYGLMNKVMRIVREESIEIAKQDFQTDCVMELWVRKNSEARVIERFASIDKLNITKI